MANINGIRHWLGKRIWGLGLLVALLVLSTLAVKMFKRPGQMNVIESQAMDMTAMKAPTGTVPVATQLVTRGSFTAKVKYTGSVVAFNEQNIYPRIQGWLTGLKGDNGDKVSAGQVLAVLEAPDVQNKLSEATYGHIAAVKEVPVAASNIAKMRAESNAARREILASQQDVNAARAEISAAQRRVTKAQQELKSANAQQKYWKTEINRQGNLLKQGAVSQQEFDTEQAQSIAAEAEVGNKQAMVEEARADLEAAQAMFANKQISVQVARDRATAAQAALTGASGELSQKAAEASMAGAVRQTAATFNQYRIIRAPFSGVVTKRSISPGVLVNPGMSILNIAQIDKVRLQANVAEQDLGSIRVGAEVTARVQKNGTDRMITAAVSSIAPSADPTSRTAIVEAIVDNRDHALSPGDFVSMEIATANDPNTLTVPTSAITSLHGRDAVWVTQCTEGTGKAVYTCTMHPEVIEEKPGTCPKCKMDLVKKQLSTGKVAHLVYVTLGRTNGERTEIVSGLNDGDEVIYAGYRYLKEGDAVAVTKWNADGPEELPSTSGSHDMDMPGMKMPESNGTSHSGHDMQNMPGM